MITLVTYILGIIWAYAFCKFVIHYFKFTDTGFVSGLNNNMIYFIILWPLGMIGLVSVIIFSLFPKIELPKWLEDKLNKD